MNHPVPPATRNRRNFARHPHPGRHPRRTLALLAAGLLAASLTVAGCTSSGEDSGSAATDRQYASEAPDRPEAGAGGAADSATDSKAPGTGAQDGRAQRKPPKAVSEHVVRKARLTVRVKDVPSALDDTRNTVENAGGYVGDETTNRDDEGHERSYLVLRVPQEKYADVLDELSGSGKLIERKVSADDVTDEVVDVKSRIASQKSSVERVRDLMDEATELSDIVSLEGELSTRQQELEALQAQQESLKDRTSLSTITLVLSETEVEKEEDETGFTDALDGGWDAFLTTMRWIAVVVGAVLPFLAALAVLLLVWRLVRNRLPQRLRRTPEPVVFQTGAEGTTPPAPEESKSD